MCSGVGCRPRGRRVTPFGHPRIKGHVLLPAAFRSLSRPSSPCGSIGIRHRPNFRLTILSVPRAPAAKPRTAKRWRGVPRTGRASARIPSASGFRTTLPARFAPLSVFSKDPGGTKKKRPGPYMENRGLEPLTLGLQSRCSEPTELIPRAPRARQGEGKEGRDRAESPSRAYTARLRGLFSAADSPSLRKEVIQPHLPVRLPCYDFTPLTGRTFDSVPLAVGLPASGTPHSDGVTGGVYKARERIHRAVLMRDY